MKVPFIDLRPQNAAVRAELSTAFQAFFDNPEFVLGQPVRQFEREFAEFIGIEHAIAVSSGTDALLCSLLALGVGPGDEVITTPFTFIATAEVILRTGAVPIFVDIGGGDYNLDVEQVVANISAKTKAIIPVHLFGNPVDMVALCRLAAGAGIAVVEDTAQAVGGRLHGRHLGSWGDLGCFSFFPSKPLGAWGDGGMIVTADAALAETCRSLRSHGRTNAEIYTHLGGNFRLDSLQAAMLSHKLTQLPAWLAERVRIADRYNEELAGVPGLRPLTPITGSAPVYGQYCVACPGGRDALQRHLAERGVETRIYYDKTLLKQPLLAKLSCSSCDCLTAERAATEVLALPIYVGLSPEAQAYVTACIREFYRA